MQSDPVVLIRNVKDNHKVKIKKNTISLRQTHFVKVQIIAYSANTQLLG